MCVGTALFAWLELYRLIPDTIRISNPSMVSVGSSLPVSYNWKDEEEVFAENQSGTYTLTCRFLGIIPVKNVTVHLVEEQQVIPAGIAAGILLETKGVYVADTGEIEDQSGKMESPAEHIVQPGDYIQAVNGTEIHTKEELMDLVSKCGGRDVILSIERDGENMDCKIEPVQTGDQDYKIGLWVKDDLAGVGTITFIDDQGRFGALGHGISSGETQSLMQLSRGSLYQSDIVAINKGKKGTPGELVGMIFYTSDYYFGEIEKNTQAGIFGKLENVSDELAAQEAVPVGYKQEIRTGKAQIRCNIDGEIKSYDIEIEDINVNSKDKNKSMLIHVTDQALLDQTGGIVQGMSGSPIIQNGKLVGAVTHVLVNDPTRGYGIFAETMLEEAERME